MVKTEPVMKTIDVTAPVAKKPVSVKMYDKAQCKGNIVKAMQLNNAPLDSSFNMKWEADQPKVCCMKFENVKLIKASIKNDKVNISFDEHPLPEGEINIEGCSDNYDIKFAPLE